MPEFVKQAELDEPANSLGYKFADPVNNKYPIHNKSACYVSNAMFWHEALSNSTGSKEVGQALIKAAEFWGILPDVQERILSQSVKQASMMTMEQLPDSSFALVQNDPENPAEKIRLYPILDPETTKLAADSLYMNRFNMPLGWKKQAATRILAEYEKMAADVQLSHALSEPVRDYLDRAAGCGITTSKTLAVVLEKRAQMLAAKKMTKESQALKEAAKVLRSQRSTRTVCEKTAALLDEVDTRTGLYREYSSMLDLPEEACHAVLTRHAVNELAKYVKTASGSTYRLDDLVKAAQAFRVNDVNVENDLGDVDFEKVREFAKTASAAEANKVDIALSNLGIEQAKLPFDLNIFTK